jgi:hypothetical protein
MARKRYTGNRQPQRAGKRTRYLGSRARQADSPAAIRQRAENQLRAKGLKVDTGKGFRADLQNIVEGVPKAGFLLGRAAASDLSPLNQARRIAQGQGPSTRLYGDVVKPQVEHVKKDYSSPGAAAQFAKDYPVSFGLDVLGVASLGAGSAVRAGLLKGPRARSLTYETRTVPLRQSPSKLTAYTQNLFDRWSEHLTKTGRDAGPLKALGARSRVARRTAQVMERDIKREKAAASADVRAVQRVGGKPETFLGIRKRPERTAFFWEAQLPESMRGGPGLKEIRADLKLRLADAADAAAQRSLRRQIAGLDAAITSPRRYDPAALESARRLMDERTTILREAGKLTDEAAESGRTWLARKLDVPAKGALYVGHRTKKAPKAAERLGQVRVGGGKTKDIPGVGKQRTGAAYETGRVRVDPDVIVEDWQRAQHWAGITRAKDELASFGEPIPLAGPTKDWLVINLDGHTLPRRWKDADADEAAVQAGMNPETAVFEEIDDYVANTFPTNEKLAALLQEGADTGRLVQVHPDVWRQFFNRYTGPQGAPANLRKVTAVSDAANDMVRFAVIYSNIGYIPANLIGNTAFALLDQGPFIVPNMIVATNRLMRYPKFRDRLLAEVGYGPTAAIASEGKNVVSRGVRAVATKEGRVADDWIRSSAWIHHARKKGYKSIDDQMRLLTDKELRPDLDDVRDQVNDSMVNFEAMGPTERAIVPRIVFVWPWIRGATVWPFRFIADHPIRAALLAHAATDASLREELAIPRDVKKWLRGAIPAGDPDGTLQKILNPRSFSPVSTPLGLAQDVLHDPVRMANPLYRLAADLWTKTEELPSGERIPASRPEIATDFLRYLPPVATGFELYDPSQASRTYGPQTRLEVLKRRMRVVPYQIDLDEARDGS